MCDLEFVDVTEPPLSGKVIDIDSGKLDQMRFLARLRLSLSHCPLITDDAGAWPLSSPSALFLINQPPRRMGT